MDHNSHFPITANLLRSRVLWLQDRDKNTKKFQSYATTRRKTNMIQRLRCDDGSWVETEKEITQATITYFQELFSRPSPNDNHDNMEFNVSSLWSDAIEELSRSYTA